MKKKRIVIAMIVVTMVLTMVLGTAWATKDETGSGAPSGPHYTLNILGKDWGIDKEPIDCGNGHRIFVKLGEAADAKKGKSAVEKTTRIMLTEGEAGEFAVIDCDGTDGKAEFKLPNPDPGKEGCTAYSVYIRVLGKPGGKAKMTTCADQCVEVNPALPPEHPDYCVVWEELCSVESVILERKGGKSKFRNVSKELLTICAEVCTVYDEGTGECIDTDWMRLYLFDPLLEGYLWKYDNKGLKHAQIRFYERETCYSVEDWSCPPVE